MTKMAFELFPLGDRAMIVQFGERIEQETNQKVKALSAYLDSNPFPGMVEYVPAFTTVTVFYDPFEMMTQNLYGLIRQSCDPWNRNQLSPYERMISIMEQILAKLDIQVDGESRTVQIPVCYGGDYGPDLEYVAKHNGLAMDEVIHIHSSQEYIVYMIGFAPGFPYLGGMSESIATPRRETPRLSIPAGSVGIAGSQTGVYPIETPGGWQLIGRTPVRLFRPDDQQPSLLQAGDFIRFYPIKPQEFVTWKETNI
jgi:inhibitor of KinA